MRLQALAFGGLLPTTPEIFGERKSVDWAIDGRGGEFYLRGARKAG